MSNSSPTKWPAKCRRYLAIAAMALVVATSIFTLVPTAELRSHTGHNGTGNNEKLTNGAVDLSHWSAAPILTTFKTAGQSATTSLPYGETASVSRQNARIISAKSMLISMIGMTAIYLIALFSQNSQSKRLFWLTLFCLSACTFFFSSSGLLERLVDTRESWWHALRTNLALVGLTWSCVSLLMFYACYFPQYFATTLLRTNVWITLAISVFITISPTPMVTALSHLLLYYWGLECTICCYILGRAVLNLQPYSKPLLLALMPLLVTNTYNVYHHHALNEMPFSSLYSMIFFIFIQILIIGRKFSAAFNLAEKLSLNLKEEVEIRTAELNDKNHKLEMTQRELQSANDALKQLSITDGLTRIYNRMYFEQEFRKEWRRSSRLQKSISILMIDVDHFKSLNDSAGHLAGDQALQSIARTLHRHFKRAGELVARYGGEEFVVMLPDTNQRKALAIAEGFRHNIEQTPIRYNQQQFDITVSIGISTATPSANVSVDHLLAAADSALYQAKNRGRNRVEIIPLLPAKPYDRKRNQPS